MLPHETNPCLPTRPGCAATADVDMFIFGLDEDGAKHLLLRLEQSFAQAADARSQDKWKGTHRAAVIRTPHTVTFAMQVRRGSPRTFAL